MPSFNYLLAGFLDTLTGHLALAVYLLAVTDERAVAKRLKKLPPLLLSPLMATLLSAGLRTVPELIMFQYYILSLAILLMCTFWARWAWQFGFWQAFAATCMAAVFQVAESTLSRTLSECFPFAAVLVIYLGISIAVALLLYRLRFGKWFRLLLDNEPAPWRTALLLFLLMAVMEVFFRLVHSIQSQFLIFYYLLLVVMVALIAALMIYLAQRFDAFRKIQMQQDMITQQQLYEQELEMIRREVRAFRHDYKNILSGLSEQAAAGELEKLRRTLAGLDAGFDLRLGKKIRTSAQIGNLRIPEVRSLLLSKLAVMQKEGIECHLEALYPVTAVDMDIWDFVRCLGILTDNAMEAAADTRQPWVEILMLARDRQVFLRISNSYANIIEPENIWKDGWSTKGTGRGLGLSGYQRILENYPNASSCTSWENGVFVQELTVEDRL